MVHQTGMCFSSMDAFGAPVTLNIQNMNKYQTCRGGLITLVIYTITLWQSLALVEQLVTQTDSQISSVEENHEADQEYGMHENRLIIMLDLKDFLNANDTDHVFGIDTRAGYLMA